MAELLAAAAPGAAAGQRRPEQRQLAGQPHLDVRHTAALLLITEALSSRNMVHAEECHSSQL